MRSSAVASQDHQRSVAMRQRDETRTPPRPSNRPAPISSARGRCSCRSAPRPIFRHGAMREIGPNGNTRSGMPASGWSRQLWSGQARPSFPDVSVRRGIRHARPRGGVDARAAHHGIRNYTSTRVSRTDQWGTAPRLGHVTTGPCRPPDLDGELRPEELAGIFRTRSCDIRHFNSASVASSQPHLWDDCLPASGAL